MKNLEEICIEIRDGDWIESKDQSEIGIRLIQTGNIGNGKYLEKESRAKFISEDTFEKLKCTEVFPGDILISRLPSPVGRACFLPHMESRAITAVDCTIVRVNTKICNPKYLVYYTQSDLYARQINKHLVGTTRLRISRKNLESVKIPLLDLEIQDKIVNILDQAQELIDKRKAQIEALDELKKSIYQKMFITINWDKNKLEEIIKEKGAIKCGPFGSQLLISEFTDGGIPVLGIENVGENKFVCTDNKYISEQKYAQLNAFRVQPGDVLISRTGTVGRTCVIPDQFSLGIIGPNLLKITPNTEIITSNYLASTFNYSRDVVNQVKLNSPGATVAVFNTGNLKKVSIPVPPIEVQNQFAEIVEGIEKQKELLNESLVELENNFNSLMQRAFKGELF